MAHSHLKLALVLAGAVLMPLSAAQADPAQDKAEATKEIWAKEMAVYAGRARGDISPYVDNVAADYAAWPPGTKIPGDITVLKRDRIQMGAGLTTSKEKLAMSFVDLRLNGDTAIVYYRTHMTMTAAGVPTDGHYEVCHVWVRENGQWHVLGGMARPDGANEK
jgi:ketosteroid isomerase-like protein